VVSRDVVFEENMQWSWREGSEPDEFVVEELEHTNPSAWMAMDHYSRFIHQVHQRPSRLQWQA
jgi:hypothetical protein